MRGAGDRDGVTVRRQQRLYGPDRHNRLINEDHPGIRTSDKPGDLIDCGLAVPNDRDKAGTNGREVETDDGTVIAGDDNNAIAGAKAMAIKQSLQACHAIFESAVGQRHGPHQKFLPGSTASKAASMAAPRLVRQGMLIHVGGSSSLHHHG